MKYSIGDIVEFKIGSIETDKEEVKFINENCSESTLYINSLPINRIIQIN